MSADERLSKLMSRGGIRFSIETIDGPNGALALITITRVNGSTQDSVGGTYDTIEEGINDCLDKLDSMAKERSRLKLVTKLEETK